MQGCVCPKGTSGEEAKAMRGLVVLTEKAVYAQGV